jgi:DNA-binding NarL/FixJ family response regulator
MMLTLLLVDDQPAVRHSLQMSLALEPDLVVVGAAADSATALRLAGHLHPDVVVMYLRMPGVDGVATTAAMRTAAPGSVVIALSLYDDAVTRAQAEAAGASAFIGKHEGMDALLAAIRAAAGRS